MLGVAPDASDAEVRRAYLALARRFHPDNNPGGEERMRAVNEAWAILGDRAKRTAYDAGAEPPRGFTPDDPVDDGFDPRAQPDLPYRAHSMREVQRFGAMTVLPVGLFFGSVATVAAGVFFEAPLLIGTGVVLFSAACLGMIGVLLVALVNARRDEG